MKKLMVLALVLNVLTGFAQKGKSKEDLVAFRIFDSKGKEVRFADASARLLKNDVVFFGELHNNAIAHWIQLRLTQACWEVKKENMFLAAEMFEADNQLGMDDFLKGNIDEKVFKEKVRLWPNYETDYKPLVDFAKEKNLLSSVRMSPANMPIWFINVV